MASKLFFNGNSTSTPVTVSKINDTAMAPKSLTVGNVLAIIGTCSGGAPNVPLTFGDPSEAAPLLVDGPLRYAVEKAFAPSAETGRPNTVIGIRVGQPTQATLNLLDTAGQTAIALTSTQYGLPANQTKVKVENGTTSGKKITTQVGTSYFVQDNLARNSFTVQYTGAQATATIAVSGTQVILSAPAITPVATLALSDFPTVQALVDRISATAGWTASVVGGAGTTATLNALDTLAAADAKTAALTITANLQAAIEWLNGLGEGFVTATRGGSAGAALVNVGWTYLAGGTNPATQFSDWTAALNALQTVDCQWLVPLTGDPAVHAAADAHAQYMSSQGRKERRVLVGPVAGTSLSAVMALPIALDSDRTALCWPGYYDFDANGIRQLYDPFYTAVLIAAGFAGSDPGTPMTNKSLAVRGLETKIRNPADTDPLIQSGVLCVEQTNKGFMVVRSISTWLVNDNYNRVEMSVGAAVDFVARNVREAVDPIRGSEANPQALARAIEQAKGALIELARPQPEGLGVIVGDAVTPAFRNIRASLAGDTLALSFECSPVIPVNFIPITISIVPYSGTATA